MRFKFSIAVNACKSPKFRGSITRGSERIKTRRDMFKPRHPEKRASRAERPGLVIADAEGKFETHAGSLRVIDRRKPETLLRIFSKLNLPVEIQHSLTERDQRHPGRKGIVNEARYHEIVEKRILPRQMHLKLRQLRAKCSVNVIELVNMALDNAVPLSAQSESHPQSLGR
jgi:hypothetical protein